MLVAQGDGPGALAAYRQSLAFAEALATRDPANTQWQRELAVTHIKLGDVLVAQGDEPGALAAYRHSLALAEALAARDRANTLWHTDVAVSCARLGTVEHGQSVETRRDYLMRGRSILLTLKAEGRSTPGRDWTDWFEQQLQRLPAL